VAIELSGDLSKTLLDLAPDATVVVDANGMIVFANSQLEQTFGHAPNELVGQPVEMLLPGRFRAKHGDHRARFAARPKLRPMGEGLQLFGQHKDGREFPVEISLSPVQTADGALVVAAVRDATVRRDTERGLVEANRAKSRLLAAASHDLRQPVQTLNLLNQAAVRVVGANTALRDILEHQRAALDTMSALLASVLDVSKLDSGAVAPAIVDCPINDVFERLRSDFGPLAEDRGIALVVESTDEGGRTDPELLRRMLGNLLSNGIRYTHAGSVRLACRREGDALAITVRDTGTGMPRSELDKIFDEFYQIDQGPRRPEGLGLGLSIVRRLAALLGHEIHVDSSVGEGTKFTVKVARVDLKPSAVRTTTAAVGAHPRARLLLIEDEAPVAHAMSLLLEIEGFDVRLASCRSEALEHVRSAVPDLVISDYHLRGTETGAHVVNEIRVQVGAPVPAIFVTGDTGKLAAAGVPLDNATLLSKPTRADELLAAIHEHIDRARAENARR
jgi:PAS domain S-box-containing protein